MIIPFLGDTQNKRYGIKVNCKFSFAESDCPGKSLVLLQQRRGRKKACRLRVTLNINTKILKFSKKIIKRLAQQKTTKGKRVCLHINNSNPPKSGFVFGKLRLQMKWARKSWTTHKAWSVSFYALIEHSFNTRKKIEEKKIQVRRSPPPAPADEKK